LQPLSVLNRDHFCREVHSADAKKFQIPVIGWQTDTPLVS
jgi:hypothetical protein